MIKSKKLSWVQKLFSKIFISLVQLLIVATPALMAFILGYIFCGAILSLMPPLSIIYLAISFLVFGGIMSGIIFFFFMQWFKKTILYKKVEALKGLI